MLSTKVDDEVMMLGIENGKYYGLNTVGSRIWELIKDPISIQDLCTLLMEEFDVDSETCLSQTIELVDSLLENNCVKICNA